MRTNSEIRAAGRFDLSGRWLEAAMLTFVYFIIATIFSATFVGAVNLWIPGMGSAFARLLIPRAWSFTMTFLANHRREDRDPFDISHLFDGYRNGQFLRIFTTEFLLGIYVFLWSLILALPRFSLFLHRQRHLKASILIKIMPLIILNFSRQILMIIFI